MDVGFRTTLLRRCYEDEAQAVRRWGSGAGRKYIQRVTTLMAVERFADLFQIKSLRLHALKGDREGQYTTTIDDRWRLIVFYDEANETLSVEEVSRHYGD